MEEFKTLVRELHRAGIEVILDVVYNHTGEGNELGPTFSFKGIDNPSYYVLTGGPHDPARYYMNWTGCGNSFNLSTPPTIRLVMDSLRYWVEAMHVDGFRFDLASVLGREGGMYQRCASFFDAVSQDPVLQKTKLIAEPWDLGSYEVGNFPVDWSEWNGRFRDTVRRFVKGDGGQLRDLGFRLTGSADLYADDGRSAYNSVNFVTCHDGFTLRDLVSFNGKHNEANLEGNRDGTDDNNSWNCGAEGETDDPEIVRLRRRLAKNHACLLLFSSGTPMILGGDEFLRTQGGTTTPIARTTRSPGSTGRRSSGTRTWSPSSGRRSRSRRNTRSSSGASSSPARTRIRTRTRSPTSSGSARTSGLPAGTIRRRGSCAASSTGARSRRRRGRTSSSSS